MAGYLVVFILVVEERVVMVGGWPIVHHGEKMAADTFDTTCSADGTNTRRKYLYCLLFQ
jgi:hypothetical protein